MYAWTERASAERGVRTQWDLAGVVASASSCRPPVAPGLALVFCAGRAWASSGSLRSGSARTRCLGVGGLGRSGTWRLEDSPLCLDAQPWLLGSFPGSNRLLGDARARVRLCLPFARKFDSTFNDSLPSRDASGPAPDKSSRNGTSDRLDGSGRAASRPSFVAWCGTQATRHRVGAARAACPASA